MYSFDLGSTAGIADFRKNILPNLKVNNIPIQNTVEQITPEIISEPVFGMQVSQFLTDPGGQSGGGTGFVNDCIKRLQLCRAPYKLSPNFGMSITGDKGETYKPFDPQPILWVISKKWCHLIDLITTQYPFNVKEIRVRQYWKQMTV
jgi:hypothetical protein